MFFFGGERGGVGAGGFAADVEDVGTLVEHGHCLGEGSFGGVFGGVEVAAVGEGVGCDVENAHDEGSLAQRQSAGAEMPVVTAAGCDGHGGILDAGSRELRTMAGVLDCANAKRSVADGSLWADGDDVFVWCGG